MKNRLSDNVIRGNPTYQNVKDWILQENGVKYLVLYDELQLGKYHDLWAITEDTIDKLRDDYLIEDPRIMLIRTSGSSGEPKLVVQTASQIEASCRATLKFLGKPGLWTIALPPSHIAGFQVFARTVVQSLGKLNQKQQKHLQDQLLYQEPGRAFADPDQEFLDRIEECLKLKIPLYTALVPTQLNRLYYKPPSLRLLAKFDAVLVGGGPVAYTMKNFCRNNNIKLITTYGMTETAGGCIYDGEPLKGYQWKLDDDQVFLTGPSVFEGYFHEDKLEKPGVDMEEEVERRRQAKAEDKPKKPSVYWFATQDVGTVLAGGKLGITGRLDDVIICGGKKTSAVMIEEALLRHENIDQVSVFSIPSEEWGEEICALYVGRGRVTMFGVNNYLMLRLGAHSVLHHLYPVREIPLTHTGKPDKLLMRRDLIRKLQEEAKEEEDYEEYEEDEDYEEEEYE